MKYEPAFPRSGFATAHDVPRDDYFTSDPQEGMTLRDYFAAHALQGFLANTTWTLELLAKQTVENVDKFDAANAMRSYKAADAMLAIRRAN